MTSACEHFDPALRMEPATATCADCVEAGGTWVHLRQCLTCGRVSCCDLSPNRHATAHFRDTAHPMIQSIEPDEDWQWCYVDDRLYEHPAGAVPGTGSTG